MRNWNLLIIILTGVTAVWAGVLAGILIQDYYGKAKSSSICQSYAVESGYAEYYLDEKNERQWRWKEMK